MNAVGILLLLLSFLAIADATYKLWIPNTNFENASNWNEQRVPCAQDRAMFPRDKGVSVFVQSLRPLTDLFLPLNGEFILSHGAGFMAAASRADPQCDQGTSIHFHDADQHQWFDPTLWRSAPSTDDLQMGKFLFAVDAESVPCHFDDVLFSPDTSFRVQFREIGSDVQLRSISVLGKKFTNNEDFSLYLKSPTGKLQFPGPAHPQVTNLRCQDDTGCLCGNEGILQEICSALLQHSGNKCPEVTCTNPLQPAGHCCGICGVTISLEYSPAFNLETYRSRLLHTFLSLPKYSSVKLAISKVQHQSSSLRLLLLGEDVKIQIVLMDGKEGSWAESDALQLGHDIMTDIETHAQSFGITKAEMQSATGAVTSPQVGAMSAGAISAIVIGVVLGLAFMGASYFLYRMDSCRLQHFQFFQFWWNGSRIQGTPPLVHRGFNNPIFEPAAETNQAATSGEGDLKEITLKESGFLFTNPLFDSTFDA